MLDVAEAGAYQKIKALPDGKFRTVVFNDAIGWTPALVRSCFLTLIKKGERLTFDFAGTSPENPSSYNVHTQAVVGHIANFMYEYFFHDLPMCSSTFAPIDFVFPEGIILNPDKMAATSCCVYIGMQTRCATHNCFAKMMFSSASLLDTGGSRSGKPALRADLQRAFAMETRGVRRALVLAEYAGAGRQSPDRRHGRLWIRLVRFRPRARLRADRRRAAADDYALAALAGFVGPGLHRGGSGAVQQWMIHKVPEMSRLCMGNGSKVPLGQPLFGGYASAPIPGHQRAGKQT